MPKLPALDASFYPWQWQNQIYDAPENLLMAILRVKQKAVVNMANQSLSDTDLANAFVSDLLANDTYQAWINFTMFGYYIQRSFVAFQHQSDDDFNTDMPKMLKSELSRHAQFLPVQQTLFIAGHISSNERREKILTASLNPFHSLQVAFKLAKKQKIMPCINILSVRGELVKGFAVKHNLHTQDRARFELMILDFHELRLMQEQNVTAVTMDTECCIRWYSIC